MNYKLRSEIQSTWQSEKKLNRFQNWEVEGIREKSAYVIANHQTHACDLTDS